MNTLGKQLSIIVGSILAGFRSSALERDSVTLVLQTLWGDKTLDLGSLGVWLLALTLWNNFSSNDELANIILLVKTEESSNLGGTLGSKALWLNLIGQTWDVTLTLLDDGESKDSKILGDNATTNRLALALTSAAWAVAGVTVGKEKSDTSGMHHTLLHWETLLVVTTSDAHNITLPLITKAVGWDLLAHLLFHKDSELSLVVDFDEFLRPVGRVGNVELHLECVESRLSRLVLSLD